MPTTSAVPRARVPSSTTAGRAISGSSRIAGALSPRYRTRSALAAASSASVIAPGPPGASVIVAFMLLRWSAATMSIRLAAVEIAVMPRRSRVVSGFMVPPEWVGMGGRRRAATRAAP